MKIRFSAYHTLVISHLAIYMLMICNTINFAMNGFSSGRYILYKYSILVFSFAAISVLLLTLLFHENFLAGFMVLFAFGFLSLLIRMMIPFEYAIEFVLWNAFSLVYFNVCTLPFWYIAVTYSALFFFVFFFDLPPSNLRFIGEVFISENSFCWNIMIFMLTISFGLFVYSNKKKSHTFKEVVDDLRREENTNKQLIEFNFDLQNYIKRYGDEAAFAERNRITREMHDANGYHFTNIMALSNAAISSGNQEWSVIEDILQQILQQSREGLIDSRRVLHELRDTFEITHRASIYTEITSIVRIFSACTDIHVDISWGNLPSSFQDSYVVTICRIIQECMVNSAKHGHATEIHISFWISKEDELILHVEDNGKGSCNKIVKGIGLSGMEERVNTYNGRLEYSSNSYGFTVTAFIPMKKGTELL